MEKRRGGNVACALAAASLRYGLLQEAAGFFGRDDAARRRCPPVVRKAEQHLVAREQEVGLAACGKDQEFLVIRIAAARQGVCLRAGGLARGDELPVGIEQGALPGGRKMEFGVGADPFQFGKTGGVGKTFQVLFSHGGEQWLCALVGKEQHVHHDIGVEYEAHQGVVQKMGRIGAACAGDKARAPIILSVGRLCTPICGAGCVADQSFVGFRSPERCLLRYTSLALCHFVRPC